jgi:hypothetical protein
MINAKLMCFEILPSSVTSRIIAVFRCQSIDWQKRPGRSVCLTLGLTDLEIKELYAGMLELTANRLRKAKTFVN